MARLLAERREPSVCLEGDWFWTTFVNGFVPPWEPAAQAQNEAVLRATFSAARELAEGGYHVVVDALVGPWSLPLVREVVGAGTGVAYVVLRPDEETCVERARTRPAVERIAGHPPLRDSGPVRTMWRQLADLGPLEHHALDNTTLTEQETVAAIEATLARATYDLP